jgi:hypothetical protein
MNTKQLLVPLFTVVVAVAGFASMTAAQAGEASYDYPVAIQSTLTRADVVADAARALAAGEVSRGELAYVAPVYALAKTRAQVVAETREAFRLGLISGREVDVQPTAAQLELVKLAGLKALDMIVVAR